MINILPLKLVKITLKIYNNENEKYNSDTDIMKELLYITSILQLNTTYPISNEDIIVENLRNIIYPFFKDYIELFIKEIKDLIDNYLKRLLYQSKYIEIIKLYVDKAKKENNC